MAKGNMMLGQASGKVGSIVFSRSNGQQVIRTKAETIKNPKTLKQTIQRILLNTCSQAYSIGQAIFDHSFEGKKAGQESMNTFMKKNLEYLRKRVAEVIDGGGYYDDLYNFVPIGMSGLYPAAWILSNGQLPKVPVTLTPFTTFGSAHAKMAVEDNTYAAIIARYGLQRGDQLTFVTIERPVDSDQVYFNYVRVILDPRDTENQPAPLSTPFIDGNAIALPNGKNEGNFGLLEFASNAVEFSLTTGDVVCAAIIVSRQVDGSWKRSSAQFVVNESLMLDTNAYSLADAVANSQGVAIDLASELYLNNAGVGGGSNAASGQGSADDPNAVYVSLNVQFTANGATATQNVSGGSVQLDAPVTAVIISGANLDGADLSYNTTNAAAGATDFDINAAKDKATATVSVAANSSLYVFKDGRLWFTITAQQPSGGGGLDEG